MRSAGTLIVLLALGCAGDDETTPIEPPACAAGEWFEDGTCVAAGLPPDMPCPPAEWLRDGACIPAGVPPDGCGEGFVHDGDRGCEPVLPAEPCGPGLMAIPGDTRCREVAPCSTGTWGAIPVEPDTEYVDASYAGMDSDGSALKPWTTVQAGIDAAASEAIVAIAQGSYHEDAVVGGKSVRLCGVCPGLVVMGTVRVLEGASGSEIKNVAIEGAGVIVGGSLDVLIERVWVHDNAGRGITLEPGSTSMTLRDSLIEQSHGGGIYIEGSEAVVEASVVRHIQPGAGLNGRGVALESSFDTPSKLVMRSSLVEQGRELGVFLGAPEGTIETSVIRGTQPALGQFGRGVSVQSHSTTGLPATLIMRTSLVEQNHDTGVFVSSATATVETTVIRDTHPDADLTRGEYGMSALRDPTLHTPSTVVLRSSLVERNPASGVYVAGADATVEASVIRDNESHTDLLLNGRGIHTQTDPWTGAPSTLAVRSSLVERNHDVGIVVAGSAATIETSIVRDTRPDAQGLTGRGVHVQASTPPGPQATILMRASLIERSHEAGIQILGAVADIDGCIVRDTYPSPAQDAGHGVTVISNPDYGAASVTVGATRVHQNALAAISSWGAYVAIGRSALSCNAFDLNAETNLGSAAEFDDLGENVCGCPEPIGSCKSVSAGLEAPPPL